MASRGSAARHHYRLCQSAALPFGQVEIARIAADHQHEPEVGQARKDRASPAERAFAARRQVAALGVEAGEAMAHRHDGDLAGIVEARLVEAEPETQPVTEASVKGWPLACARVPGAWLAMSSRAVGAAWMMGRGSCGSDGPKRGASRQSRQALSSATSLSSSLKRAVLRGHGIAGPGNAIVRVSVRIAVLPHADDLARAVVEGPDAGAAQPLEAPAEFAERPALGVIVADGIALHVPAGFLVGHAVVVAKHPAVGGVILAVGSPLS